MASGRLGMSFSLERIERGRRRENEEMLHRSQSLDFTGIEWI